MPFYPQVNLALTPIKDASLDIRDNYGKLQLLKTQRPNYCGVCSSNGISTTQLLHLRVREFVEE